VICPFPALSGVELLHRDWALLDAHPATKVSDDIAYVTEPAKNAVHAVDLTTGEVVKSVTLEQTRNEIALTK
jgi:hypothetical protein